MFLPFRNDSDRPDFIEVFMSEGDYEAAMRLAVVSIEPPSASINAMVAVQAALAREVPDLTFDVEPSSVGVMYLRLASWAERKRAMQRQTFPHEGTCIDLFWEELFCRMPQRARFCVLLVATSFPAEFLTPAGIHVAFSGFGKLMEVDPRVFAGRELATVRALVLMERPRDVPCDVWPWGGCWGARVITVEPLKFWDMAEFFSSNGKYIPLFRDPPRCRLRTTWRPPWAPGAAPSRGWGGAGQAPRRRRRPLGLRPPRPRHTLLCLAPCSGPWLCRGPGSYAALPTWLVGACFSSIMISELGNEEPVADPVKAPIPAADQRRSPRLALLELTSFVSME